MQIELTIDYKNKPLFSRIFDRDATSFNEFRAAFNRDFALKHPRLSLDRPEIRETWRRVELAKPPTRDIKNAPHRSDFERTM